MGKEKPAYACGMKMTRRKDEWPKRPPEEPETDSPFSEPVIVPIEDSIDLHTFSPRDIPGVVEEYIEQCRHSGIYEVRIIHGRGKGVQRRIVRSILEKHPLVASFKDAPLESGGWGSTVAVLKR